MNIKKIFSNPIIFVILIVIILIGFNFWQNQIKNNIFFTNKKVTINEIDLKVKIAKNSKETYQGLSEQKKIPTKTGMLFIYDKYSPCYHVMRGMLFDLDFIFLKDGKVVSIKKNISKDFNGIIQSSTACNQVLEINAGEVDELGLKIGDIMIIKD